MASSEMYLQDPPVQTKTGYFIPRKIALIGSVLFALIFIGSLIAVYNSKSTPLDHQCVFNISTTQMPPVECKSLFCQDRSVINEWETTCPVTSSEPAQTKPSSDKPVKNYRLPRDLKPFFYEILVKPFFNVSEEPSYYNGHVLIKFKCLNNTSKLVFHKHPSIEIDNLSFELRSLTDRYFIAVIQMRESNFLIESWSYDNETQKFHVEFYKEIFRQNEEYSLGLGFKGVLNNDNIGFYKSSYLTDDGQKRWLLASQMEATEARKAFPCFDEPDMKAKFKLRVIHDSTLTPLSNMPVKSITKIDSNDRSGYNWIQTDFNETVEMSSYLVALVLSDFECLTRYVDLKFSKNISVSVCSRPNAKQHLHLALNASVEILTFFESYYNIEYPLTKLYHVALPDFSAGAMENWGLITYREARLFYDPKKTSQAAEEGIIEVIAHEIAHQWFGNLVSPVWWTDLWLNEGFARYMQIVGTDSFKPEWNMFDLMMRIVLSVMEQDSVQSSHPISIEVNNPDEINEIFDSITYGKGASVIRMIYYFLGETSFNRGLTEYLKKYSYGNAIQDNLWQSLQEFSAYGSNGLNLTQVLNTWTKQMGYPLINIKLVNSTHIVLTQEHFLFDPSLTVQKSPYNYKWYVPFSFSTERLRSSGSLKAAKYNVSNINTVINWMEPNQTETILQLEHPLDNSSFILANLDSSGFYRVQYDETLLSKIKTQLSLNHQGIPVRMRAQLISDIFSLLQANKIESSEPFEFVEYLTNEDDYLPWYSFVLKLSYFFDMIESTEVYGDFRLYVLKLVEPLYKKIGWEDKVNDSWLNKKLRSLVISLACRLDHDDCIQKSVKLYKDWMKTETTNNIPKNLRSTVYCTSIKFGTYSEWNFASVQYDKESDSNSKKELQLGMSCSKEQWIQIKYLNDQLNLNKTRKQDGLFGIRYSATNLYSNKITWAFVKNNWNVLTERYGSSMSFSYLVSDLSSKFNSENDLNDFVSFYSNVSLRSAGRQVKISTERIQANIKWVNSNYNNLFKWFNGRNSTRYQELINYRLPEHLKPFFYDLRLKVNLKSPSLREHEPFTFDGDVKIMFTCLNVTNRIVLHQKNLKISSFKVFEGSRLIETENEIEYDLIRDFITIGLKDECSKGVNYTLQVIYTGNLTDTLSGFYLSSYVDETGQINYLGTTQFEPTYARKAFPSFDEPHLKAQFKISLIRHRNLSSVSNMPLEEILPLGNDFFMDVYEKSVPMSTYLVAFVISNFKTIKKLSPIHRVSVEVMARPEAIQKGYGNFALDEAARILDHFSEYFNTTYPLPKSTQIALPDFNAGAMENWGLVTYREKYLLHNPDFDSITSKRLVSVVISHELAHQWFGNLVSPQWWNDLWLNEGFASWVEYLGVNYTHPEWKDLDYFIVEKLSSMVKDSFESSHAISTHVNNPSEIDSLFDEISYDKGSCLVRMMNSFLTINTFKKGISNYLQKFKFKNANQDMLWNELCKQACKDGKLTHSLQLKTIMDTWTLKKGYPVINVKKYNENGMTKLRIEQKWFLLNPLSEIRNSVEYNRTKWYVPFTFTTKTQPLFDFESKPYWLDVDSDFKTIDVPETDWVIGNIKFSGYYRVNYDDENWKSLIKQLNEDHRVIDVVNRAQLVDDSFNLARAEQLNIETYLNLITYLKNETSNIPFDGAFKSVKFMDNMIRNSDYYVYEKFKTFIKSLYKKSYDRLGWSNQTEIGNVYLQIDSIKIMCTYGHLDCLEKSRLYFEGYKLNSESVPKNLRKIVLNTIVKYGSQDDWMYLFKRAESIRSNEEKLEILKALTFTRDHSLLSLILKSSSNRSLIRSQDEDTIISLISQNELGKSIVLDFMMENWNYFEQKLEVAMFMNSLVKDVFENYNTRYELKKIENFVEKLSSHVLNQLSILKEVTENVVINIRWMDVNYKKISQWLMKY